jgi:proteasome lid subunit RPN8/RPN11
MQKVSVPCGKTSRVRIVALRSILLATAGRLRFSRPIPLSEQSAGTLAPVAAGSSLIPELSYQIGASEVRVIVSGQARQALIAHCEESNIHGREVGGILIGYRYERVSEASGEILYFTTLTDLIPVQSRNSSEAHVQFDEESWEWVERQMTERFSPEGKCRLGWYHTHPSQGIFFSGQDRDAHTIFQQPWQFALVVDPQVMEAGFFYWTDYHERMLNGPLRFRLTTPASAERVVIRSAPASAEPAAMRGVSKPSERTLHRTRFALFWALAGLVSGYIAGLSGQGLPAPWHVCVLAAIVLAALKLWNLGFFHPRLRIVRIGKEGKPLPAPLVPRVVYTSVPVYAAAVLTIFFTIHYAARQIPAIVSPTAPASPVRPLTGNAGIVDAPPVVAELKAPAPQNDLASAHLENGSPVTQSRAAAAPVSETIRIFVKEDSPRRDGSRRIVLGSGLPPARVSYSVRDCPRTLRESALTPCSVTTRGPEEARFFDRIFQGRHFNEEVDSVKALQTALGFPDPPDGKWGPRSRAAWLARAVKPSVGVLHISLPGSVTAAVHFERASRP